MKDYSKAVDFLIDYGRMCAKHYSCVYCPCSSLTNPAIETNNCLYMSFSVLCEIVSEFVKNNPIPENDRQKYCGTCIHLIHSNHAGYECSHENSRYEPRRWFERCEFWEGK